MSASPQTSRPTADGDERRLVELTDATAVTDATSRRAGKTRDARELAQSDRPGRTL
jgi:hypothetical protein